MKESILITGASGFLGYHLVQTAIEKGLEVHAAVRKTSKIDQLQSMPVNFEYCNFSSLTDAVAHFKEKRYNYVVHAAGIVKSKNESAFYQVNTDLTKTIAEAAIKAELPIKKFIYISSLAAIGPSHSMDLITEQMQAKPLTYYGKSKLMAENFLNELDALPKIIFRPTAIYGPREREIFALIKGIMKGIEPYIGKIEQKLSFVYVKDLASLVINSLHSNVQNKTYNVSDGNAYSRYDLANSIKEVLNKKTLKIHLPLPLVQLFLKVQAQIAKLNPSKHASILSLDKLGELTAKNWICSTHKLEKELGFKPSYDLNKGLKETMQWYADNNWIKI